MLVALHVFRYQFMLFEDDPLQEEEQNDVSLPNKNLVLVLENFDDFKADKEAKLEEWLGGTDNPHNHRDASDAKRAFTWQYSASEKALLVNTVVYYIIFSG